MSSQVLRYHEYHLALGCRVCVIQDPCSRIERDGRCWEGQVSLKDTYLCRGQSSNLSAIERGELTSWLRAGGPQLWIHCSEQEVHVFLGALSLGGAQWLRVMQDTATVSPDSQLFKKTSPERIM